MVNQAKCGWGKAEILFVAVTCRAFLEHKNKSFARFHACLFLRVAGLLSNFLVKKKDD